MKVAQLAGNASVFMRLACASFIMQCIDNKSDFQAVCSLSDYERHQVANFGLGGGHLGGIALIDTDNERLCIIFAFYFYGQEISG